MDNPDLDRFPVGAGPFKVVDHQPGTVITFERFEDYWEEGVPKLAELELQMQLDEETRIRALLSGEIDATVMNSAVGHVEQAEEAGLGVAAEFGTGQWTIFLNKARNPALGVLEVRQALMHAIDRQSLVDGLFTGYCTPAHQPFPVEWWAGNPEVGPDYYPYDPERARELLAEGGYPDGFTMNVVVANVPSYAVVLEAVQAQLAEVGVDMQIQVVEPAQLLATFVGGDTDGYYTIFPGGVDPAKVAALLLLPNSSLNPGGVTPDAIVELAEQGLEASSEEERAPIYQEMSKVAADEAMHLVLCHPPFTEGFQPDVVNLHPNISIHATDFRYVGKLADS